MRGGTQVGLAMWVALASGPGCEEAEPLRRRAEALVQRKLESERERVESVSDVRSELSEEERARLKVELYDRCLQMTAPAVDEHAERLLRVLGSRIEPGTRLDVLTAADLNPCEKAVVDGLSMPPALPELDRAFQSYLDQLRAYAKHGRVAADYLAHETHRDDGGAGAREIRAKAESTLNEWREARAELEPVLGPRALAVARHRAENDPGTDLERSIHELVVEARALGLCARAQVDARRFGCDASAEAYEAAHQRFVTQSDAAIAGPDEVFWLTGLARTAAELADAARALRPLPRGRQRAARTAEVEDLVQRLRRDQTLLWVRERG